MTPYNPNEPSDSRAEVREAAIRGGKALVFGKILNQVISFGVVWVQAHFLPVWAYGVFGLFLGTFSYISWLGGSGTMDIAHRFLPEFAEKGDIRSIARTTRGLVLILLILCSIVLGLILIFFDTIGPLLKIEEYKEVFAFFSIGILFTLECHLMFSVYWALLKQPAYVVALTIHNIFRVVVFYLVLSRGGGIAEALLVEALSYLLLFGLLYFPFAFEFNPSAPKTDPIPFKRMLKYGFYMHSNNLGQIFFNTATDLYVISAVLGKYELGLYAFAATLGQAIMKWMPDKLIGSVIETVTYREWTRDGSTNMLSAFFSRVFSLQAFFVVPTAVFLMTFASPLIEWVFDPKFIPAAGICGGLALVFSISALKFPLTTVVASLEKPRILFISQTVFAIYNLVADIILIPRFGLWGAVIATGTSYLFMFVTIWITVSRQIKLTIDLPSLLKISVNSLLMGAFFFTFSNKISSVFEFFAFFLAGGSIYLVLSYFNCPIDKEAKARILSFIVKKKPSDN